MRRTTSIILLSVSLAFSCGPSPEDVPFLRTDRTDTDPDADASDGDELDDGDVRLSDAPLEDWDVSDGGPLTGIFAIEVIVNANVVIDIETRQLYRLRIHQNGRTVRQHLTLCELSLPTVEGVAELRIPPATEAVIQTKSDEREGDFLDRSDPLVGATYIPDPATIVVGAELTSDEDPLPTSDDPTNASDEDGDGEPGVTIVASTLVCDQPESLYVALRVSASLAGTIDDLDTISGTVEPELEQSVLGYSDPCLAPAASLPIEITDGSRFLALRTTPEHDLDQNGNVSCDEISESAVELFGDYWLPAE